LSASSAIARRYTAPANPAATSDAIVELAGARELTVLEIEIRELLLVADRRVVDDDPLELLRRRRGERVDGAAQQIDVGHRLGGDVDERARPAADQDDPQPVSVGPTPHEMEKRRCLQDETSWICRGTFDAAR
jgi:hypothetical protein